MLVTRFVTVKGPSVVFVEVFGFWRDLDDDSHKKLFVQFLSAVPV